jgi:phage gpG-like protein
MTPGQAAEAVKRKMAELKRFREEDVPDIIGTEAVNHFNESFVNEGFTDKGLVKWQDVKRRNPNSEWYGFSAGNKKRFSPTRASDKILTGETSELKNSIHYVVKPDRVTVRSDKPYASVHQFGEPAKVFGKKAFTMKARPFIGRSAVLENEIRNKIIREYKKIITQQ